MPLYRSTVRFWPRSTTMTALDSQTLSRSTTSGTQARVTSSVYEAIHRISCLTSPLESPKCLRTYGQKQHKGNSSTFLSCSSSINSRCPSHQPQLGSRDVTKFHLELGYFA